MEFCKWLLLQLRIDERSILAMQSIVEMQYEQHRSDADRCADRIVRRDGGSQKSVVKVESALLHVLPYFDPMNVVRPGL